MYCKTGTSEVVWSSAKKAYFYNLSLIIKGTYKLLIFLVFLLFLWYHRVRICLLHRSSAFIII